MIVLILLGIILLGVGVYFLFIHDGDEQEPEANPTTTTEQAAQRPQIPEIEARVKESLAELGYTQEDLDEFLGEQAPELDAYVTCLSEIVSENLSDESLQTFMKDPMGFTPSAEDPNLTDLVLQQCTVATEDAK